jgi:hypothetical protein
MQRVLRTDEQLAGLVKPPLQPVSDLRLQPHDCLIICAGFEERCLGLLRRALAIRQHFRVILVEYLPFIDANKAGEIIALCEQGGVRPNRIVYDRQNPAGFGALLAERASPCSGRLYVDVSAMSRLLIVQALVALRAARGGFKRSVIVYSEAQTYPPDRQEVEAGILQSEVDPLFVVLFLSSGVYDVTIVPELSALSFGANQTRLVVFPSFNANQLTALRAELQPSRFTLIHGNPPSLQNQWRPEAISRLNRLDSVPNAEHAHTSTLDYRETLDCLLDLYGREATRERLLISPTGSKMQTVAVGLFRAFMDDVQIVYPTPKEFRSPANYTKGVGQLYSLDLCHFGIAAH